MKLATHFFYHGHGRFTYCRGMYTSGRRDGSGNGWTTDYPDADVNFSIRFSELTKVTISRTAEGEPNHLVVPLAHPYLFQCPFLMMTDVGEILFSSEEAREGMTAFLQRRPAPWAPPA